MIFQKVLKGISGIDRVDARSMLDGAGIICNWWRVIDVLPADEIPIRLSEGNLLRHLNQYTQPDPLTGKQTFGEFSPFISTTAGCVERDPLRWRNWQFSAFITALAFATDNFTSDGVIFYAYLNVLGKKSVIMEEFAEETRELHIWTSFQQYHPEGEVVAKISIPSPHIEKVEGYRGTDVLRSFGQNVWPQPAWTELNTQRYVKPEDISNIRDVLM